MIGQRVVLGAVGDPDRAARAARRLRDEGREVVYVGGHQSPEQLVRALVAEDAATLVVDAGDTDLDRITRLCAELGAEDAEVTPLDESRLAPRSR